MRMKPFYSPALLCERLTDQHAFAVLSRWWVVEQNFGRLKKQRRLVSDNKTTIESAEA